MKKIMQIINRLIHPGPAVHVLRLSGIIGDAGMFKPGLTIEAMEESIRRSFEQKPKAVALQVNSPGGSPVQSELICKRIRELAEEKKIPVYTFVEEVAASGGYWLACAGDEIYASENSIVGSIGVITAGFGLTGAIKKLGIERRVYKQGENKSILDPFEPEEKEGIKILLDAQKDVHESFKTLVRNSRKGKLRKADENLLFSGAFWSGKKAENLGLVDGIADMRGFMKKKYGKKVRFVMITRSRGWLRRRLSFTQATTDIAASALHYVYERQLWGRYGF